ncbi:glycoside hydrolase family 76 protein [Dothistroma septosporum NZE10]|uniref:Glycoside hydrolase family 76 protein n=1 Tax=Dothistroma septosporum (strain NZE10 / CBS 128990) TaxID=675120 RepID=N1PLA6_DOTSN|nr:glycoside hydrolase family 76 protein [Dothistroma septosporum NZE10]
MISGTLPLDVSWGLGSLKYVIEMKRQVFQWPVSRVWLAAEVFVLTLAVWSVFDTFKQGTLLAPLLGTSHAIASIFWNAWNILEGTPWRYSTSKSTDGGYWFEQTQDVVAALQSTYFNGSYWVEDPEILQWTGALVDTIFIGTQRTFTRALSEYDGDAHGAEKSAAEIQADIQEYFSQVEGYYGGEDTNQIFDAAYDDAQWVVLEWLEAIKFVEQYDAYAQSSYGQEDIAGFAHRAHIFYNVVQDKFNTTLCEGGITWNPTLAPYKNAITNELFVSSSIAMYLYFPGDDDTDPNPSSNYTNKTLPALPFLRAHDPLLLQNAREEWTWFKSHNFTNAQGLIVDGFHVSENQTSCDERNEMVYTYNQGIMLSGLRGLWEATGDTSYLEEGYDLIATVIDATGWNDDDYAQATDWCGLGRAGILEDYCDAPANCSQDALVFKGAYFEHLDLFCEPLPTSTPLVAGVTYIADSELAAFHVGKCTSYAPWIRHNAWAALNTRDDTGIIGEWWGASYITSPQTPALKYAEPKPYGSMDVWNEPQLLLTAPWKCDGFGGCRQPSTFARSGRRAARLRRETEIKRRRSGEQIRTAETQAQGLAVVKAAANSRLRR